MIWCWGKPIVADFPTAPPISPRLTPDATCRVPCTHLWLPVSFSLGWCPTKGVHIPRNPLSIKERQELGDWLFPPPHPQWKIMRYSLQFLEVFSLDWTPAVHSCNLLTAHPLVTSLFFLSHFLQFFLVVTTDVNSFYLKLYPRIYLEQIPN